MVIIITKISPVHNKPYAEDVTAGFMAWWKYVLGGKWHATQHNHSTLAPVTLNPNAEAQYFHYAQGPQLVVQHLRAQGYPV